MIIQLKLKILLIAALTIFAGLLGYLNQLGVMYLFNNTDFKYFTFILVLHLLINLPLSAFNQNLINKEYSKNNSKSQIQINQLSLLCSTVSILLLFIIFTTRDYNYKNIEIILISVALSTSYMTIDLIAKYYLSLGEIVKSGLTNTYIHLTRILSLITLTLFDLGFHNLFAIYVIFQLVFVLFYFESRFLRMDEIRCNLIKLSALSNGYLNNLLILILVNIDFIIIYILDIDSGDYLKVAVLSKTFFYIMYPINNYLMTKLAVETKENLIQTLAKICFITLVSWIFSLVGLFILESMNMLSGNNNFILSIILGTVIVFWSICNFLDLLCLKKNNEQSPSIYFYILSVIILLMIFLDSFYENMPLVLLFGSFFAMIYKLRNLRV
jgi:hypothetical protein